MPDAALLVFAKVPEAGAVKTRLAPPLTLGAAAALYAAFLADALTAFAAPGAFGVDVDVRLHLAPSDAPLPAGLVPDGVSVHTQRGHGLGARMASAIAEAFAAGYGRAVITGTDHPTLPLAFVADAFRALAGPPQGPPTVVLGPSDDGGYYLIGLDRPLPSLFEMTYSHAGVFEATRARAAEAGARTVVLPPGYDVDDGAGLVRLITEWRAGASVGPKTAAALARLEESGLGGVSQLHVPSAPRPGRTA